MNGRCYVCVLLIEDQKLRAGEQEVMNFGVIVIEQKWD